MIAPYFVPRRRVGSLRPYRFVIHLQSFGWKPVVCTIQDQSQEKTDAEIQALKNVEILELKPPFDRTGGPPASSGMKKKRTLSSKAADALAEWFDSQVPMDTWIFLFRSSYGKILEKARAENPDIIWSTGDPWSGHWVGHKLSRDLNKPWIADFRDPWTQTNLNLRRRSRFSDWRDRKLEKKFISAADRVVFTSKATERAYQQHYRLDEEKTATIYNSYHPVDQESSDGEWDAEIDSSRVNLLFFGSFRRLSPAAPVANAVGKLTPEEREKIRIHSFGNLEESDTEYLEKMRLKHQFITHEKVLPTMAPSVFKKADLLLLSTSRERKHIIPAKLWEYLNSDKPILSIAPNPEIGEILARAGAGVHFENQDSDAIARFLSAAVQKKEKGEKPVEITRKPKTDLEFSPEYTTRQLAGIMEELTTDG
ncbi:glycosyltransferase [Rhodohalobacter sp. SW132]|uniref:glycosyltransferase n=1 Tax=Rhodohalobacter sp. SW132 TaxID=2293433 RepID=UPI0013147D5F|nr:glycosyltransferase [Rhodohalobacter sp. SW132]